MKLDNPLLVRPEYASEGRLAKRNEIFRALIQGPNPEDNIAEFWELIDPGLEPRDPLSLNHENGEERLSAAFGRVERSDVEAEFVEPFRATSRHVVFVAEQPKK